MDIQVCAMTGVFCHVLIEWNVLGLGVFGMSLFPFFLFFICTYVCSVPYAGYFAGYVAGLVSAGFQPRNYPRKMNVFEILYQTYPTETERSACVRPGGFRPAILCSIWLFCT